MSKSISLSSDLETRALLGRSVTDSYGRNIGRVIGLDRNHYGELEAIQVEAVAGQVISANAKQLSVTPKTVTLSPEWKTKLDDLVMELSILHRRVIALEQLKASGEISGELYKEMLDDQRKGYTDKIHEGKQLIELMMHKLSNTETQVSSLTRYLATAKLDNKSGILDTSSFQIAEQSIRPTLASLILEKSDLNSSIKRLEQSMSLQ